MNKSDWLKFTWNLKSVPNDAPIVPDRYLLRRATREEEKTVMHVAQTAFGLDSSWSHLLKPLTPRLEQQVDKVFSRKDEIDCVVLTHGPRIIGLSLLDSDEASDFQLFTGPLMLVEYRSRGLGGTLLQESFRLLSAGGLVSASGITPKGGVAARFVYPKFGGLAEPYAFETTVFS